MQNVLKPKHFINQERQFWDKEMLREKKIYFRRKDGAKQRYKIILHCAISELRLLYIHGWWIKNMKTLNSEYIRN